MSEPKRHHFVAEMLQKRFCNDKGRLWTYDSAHPENDVREDKPGNLLVVGHLYSEIMPDGKKNTKLETDFSRLESAANDIIEKMLEAVRNDRFPALTLNERRHWAEFFIQQIRRVPDNFDRLITPARVGEEYTRILDELAAEGHRIPDEVRQEAIDPDRLKTEKQNLRVRILRSAGPWADYAVKNKVISFGRVDDVRKSLILCSSPIARVLPNKLLAADPGAMQPWLPLAKDVACVLHAGPIGERIVELDRDKARFLNVTLASQSSQIVGCAEALVQSLRPYVGSDMIKTEEIRAAARSREPGAR